MSYEELGNLINEGKDDEIREALNGLSEQELGMLLDMVTPEQASYINYLNTFDNAPDSFMDEDEMNDWILSHFSGELPEARDSEAWNEFYAAGSPFNMYETRLTHRLRPRIKHPWETAVDNDNDDGYVDVLGMKLTKAQLEDMEANGIDPETYVKDYQSDYNSGFEAALKSEDGICPANMGDAFEDGWSDGLMDLPKDKIDAMNAKAEAEDVNGDGDTDVATADTNGNGEKDTAVVTADSEPEKKEAIKAAKEDLGLDKEDKTSTGKTKGELEDDKKSAKEIRDERTKSYGPMREYHDMDDKDVVSDKKKKDMTCSDATQKNIMAALLDHRF